MDSLPGYVASMLPSRGVVAKAASLGTDITAPEGVLGHAYREAGADSGGLARVMVRA
jgi:hypothetical protein